MEVSVTGGGWVTAQGYGAMSDDKEIILSPGQAIAPKGKAIFPTPAPRYGRFDAFTKLGCAAVALTIKDAEITNIERTDNIGMVLSSQYDTLKTDIDYYQTTLDEGGTLASPNLFSYTLPVILLGECAVMFQLEGPTLCIGEGEKRGLTAIKGALDLMAAGKSDKILAGWVDTPPHEEDKKNISGSIFVLLEKGQEDVPSFQKRIVYNKGMMTLHSGQELTSICELFN